MLLPIMLSCYDGRLLVSKLDQLLGGERDGVDGLSLRLGSVAGDHAGGGYIEFEPPFSIVATTAASTPTCTRAQR